MTNIHYLRLLLLGLWLGAAIFFAASVAPTVFGELRDAGLVDADEFAARIVTRSIAVINSSGFAVGLFLLMTAYFSARSGKRLAVFGEMICASIMVIMTGVSTWVISPRMLALRVAMRLPINQIVPTDPRGVEFDSLHHYSVMVMGVAMVAALLAFVFASRSGAGSVPREST